VLALSEFGRIWVREKRKCDGGYCLVISLHDIREIGSASAAGDTSHDLGGAHYEDTNGMVLCAADNFWG
jgi:hypothetical protein